MQRYSAIKNFSLQLPFNDSFDLILNEQTELVQFSSVQYDSLCSPNSNS